jgi:UDPglucose 6-dehydrogenase
VQKVIDDTLRELNKNVNIPVVSNPEFLKEGAAIEDFMKPDRIVIGVEDPSAEKLMRQLYDPFQRNHDRTLVMTRRSAELTKYAANAMLATRISFMNELARLAEGSGADIEDVRRGIGSDPRIGYSFLYAGTGYGGSCFPKDVSAAISTGQDYGVEMEILKAVESVNSSQKKRLFEKAKARFGDLKGRQFGMWGLAFKPNTDDMREAPSLVLIQALLDAGARVCAYDPVAGNELSHYMPNQAGLTIAKSAEAVLEGSDALFVVTEWSEFRSPDFQSIKETLNFPVIFDGRNMYEPDLMLQFGFEYFGIGRGAKL